MTIPVNGYLAVYVSNASNFAQCSHCNITEGDVFFDKLKIKFTRGNLKEENHYYPYGLPMAAIGSSAMGMTLNRQKYQSNEYITEAGLNWMSFGARQYDPQIGRFLSVDPMAAQGGQEMLSPYQAMGDNPTSMTDPGGTQTGQPGGDPKNPPGNDPPVNVSSYVQIFVPAGMGGPSASTNGFTGGFSSGVLNDISGNINTDPMNQSFWYDHAIGADGKIYNVCKDMDGNVLSVTLGNNAGNSGGIPTNEEKSSTGDEKGNNKSASNDGDNSEGSSFGEKAKDQTGNVGFALDVVGYEMEHSSFVGFSKWGQYLGGTGDLLGGAGVYFDYKNYKAGKMSGERFGYHAFSFGASTIIGNTLGASAGLETGGFLFYLESVQLGGQLLWNNFKASYNSWYQQSVMIIENGGNPFEHMHYSF